MNRAAILLLVVALSGCFQSDPNPAATEPTVTEPEDEPVAPELPVPVSWWPEMPTAGQTVLLQVDDARARSVLWTIGERSLDGRVVQTLFAAGTHDVQVSYTLLGDQELYGFQLVVAAVVDEVEKAPEAPASPPTTPAQTATPPATVRAVQQRNSVSFSLDWDLRAARIQWFFGDGTSAIGLEPVHDYLGPGTYSVLAVATAGQHTVEAPATINIADVPLTILIERIGTQVTFRAAWDQPSASYTWDLGEGGARTGPTVIHDFATGGPHTIKLSASGGGQSEQTERILSLEDFPFDVTHAIDDNIVTFGATWGWGGQWNWRFGDGTGSTDAAPEKRYPAVGLYHVTVTGTSGEYTFTHTFPIEITEMKLGFTKATDVNEVTFDATWDLAGTYAWHFGDGVEGAGEQAVHAYPEVRTYQATLFGSFGGQIERVQQDVHILTQPVKPFANVPPGNVATFGFTWSNEADTVAWDFGDSGTSTEAAPVHVFADGKGTYTVTITVTNDELVAAGIPSVSGTIELSILFDGVPQFTCWGEPVFEDNLRAGADPLVAWGAFKDGSRAAVVWSDALSMDTVELQVGGADVDVPILADGGARMAIQDDLSVDQKICWRGLDDDVVVAGPHGILTQNAMSAHDGGAYQVNMLYLAGEGQPVASVQTEVGHFAGTLRDMTDGHIQAGLQVLVHGATEWAASGASTASGYGGCVREEGADRPACSMFDVIFTNNGRPDAAGFTTLNGIQENDATIVVITQSWAAQTDGPHQPGGTLTHEFGHYGLGLMDLYVPIAPFYAWLIPQDDDCFDPVNDLSIMGGTGDPTELDDEVNRCPNEDKINDYWASPTDPSVPPLLTTGDRYVPSWTLMRDNFPLIPDRTIIVQAADGTGNAYQFNVVAA